MTQTTLVCIFCSFVGIFLLLTGEEFSLDEKDMKFYLVGYLLSFYCAVSFATIGVLTRSLKEIHFAKMAFFYALGSFVLSFSILVIEYLLSDRTIPRFFTYELEAYKYMCLAGFLSATSILLSTKAM